MTRTSAAIVFALLLTACRRDMQDQPKYKPLGKSDFFPDHRASRPVPANTVAVDELNTTDTAYTGLLNTGFAPTLPMPVSMDLLLRGQQRFDIFCTPCHGYLGNGDGMVARRGFKQPVDLNSDRVRREPPGYIFQVITNGFGAMPDYKDQIPPGDRWAIVAYVRALELSQNATVTEVPPEQRSQIAEKTQ